MMDGSGNVFDVKVKIRFSCCINKKDSDKRHYPFYMGRSGLEPPTSPLSVLIKVFTEL